MVREMEASKEKIIEYLEEITDPEIPVLNIVELGIVRDARHNSDSVQVEITPTYSGCPAMKVIENAVLSTLQEKGFENVSVKIIYSPPWTSDWLTDEARQKLKDYGIAPPEKGGKLNWMPFSNVNKKVTCPFCDSVETELTSEFGSTACKSLYYCNNCQQPFEHFKCI
jgi:ring-1,2-phenylacetyl-CoA epoxidase subunit PaaD